MNTPFPHPRNFSIREECDGVDYSCSVQYLTSDQKRHDLRVRVRVRDAAVIHNTFLIATLIRYCQNRGANYTLQ